MNGVPGVPRVSVEDVRAALERLTVSHVFAGADRMRRFLQLVVEETIAGNGGSLKEYRIGVEVFDRGQAFDPRTDTIVRVEARRLRQKLEEYYSGTGRHDPLIIRVPLGAYVPSFANRDLDDGPVSALDRHDGSTAPRASIAVLPFLDLSEAGDQEYLCDGFSEELLNALSRIPALKVAARTSAFRFKGKADDIRRIGTELAVEHILEGSVRLFGPQMRVTVQLVRASDGYHVWSRQFDRPFSEALSLQSDVARQVAASVGVELGSGSGTDASCSADAYRSYLEGRHDWRQFTPASTARAVDGFERAIRIEPSFAPAHAGLAAAYMQMNVYGMASPRDLAEKARTAANRALALDPQSVEALTQLGAVNAYCDWDWASSEEHFRRALHIQPNYVDARWLMATVCLGPQHRLDEALREAREAARQDPLSPLTQAMVGAVHLYRGDYDAALAALDAADAIAPFSQTSLFRGFVNLARGRPDLAAVGHDHSPYRLYVQAMLGHAAAVRAEIDALRTRAGSPLAIAAGYAGLGDIDQSLEWLERAVDRRIPQLIWIDFQQPWAVLRGTPRFEDLRQRMHLPVGEALSAHGVFTRDPVVETGSDGEGARPPKA